MNKKVWVEINTKALRKNIFTLRSHIGGKVKLLAVIKSNAYGHGLIAFSQAAVSGVDGFCVDSVIEGIKLRRAGIKKTILVLGPTLHKDDIKKARREKITLSVSSMDALRELSRSVYPPAIHIKIDTGMHRQGIYIADLKKALALIKQKNLPLVGIYTHFAFVKNPKHKGFTKVQSVQFTKAFEIAKEMGFSRLLRHAAATRATFDGRTYLFDAVRVGKGLYGLWSKKGLTPVLSWRTRISEIKNVPKGAYVGYDLTERVKKNVRIAVLPIGYWHGFPRSLSSHGEVLIRGRRARVVGRVSMDLTVVDITNINARVGDVVTLIGESGKNRITAEEFGEKAHMSNSESTTHINPLIERILT